MSSGIAVPANLSVSDNGLVETGSVSISHLRAISVLANGVDG